MCFADRIPRQDVFDRYYEVMSKYESPQRAPDEHDPSWRRLLDVVPYVERAVRPDDSVLEIGCASGQLLHVLKQRGFSRLAGIDPSPMCARTARECYGLAVESGTFSSLASRGAEVDCVILIGVLEHLGDISQALAVVRALLKDDGKVFITVPDASRYVNGVDAPFQEFSVEHINFFGRQSLMNLMSANGFDASLCESASVRAHATTITPAIHGAFAKRRESTIVERPRCDDKTAGALHAYIRKSQHEHEAVLPKLEKLAEGHQPVVIWGAGAHTLRLLAQGPLSGANVLSIIDSNPRYHGKSVGTVPVVGPESRPDEQVPILVSSRVYQDAICHQIRAHLKWNNPLITLY
jgi:SAM-dependent methyltransferase